MDPHLSDNDKKLFYDYLNKSRYYFEYGSGGSTYQACIRNNILKVYSVESDLEWHNKIKNSTLKQYNNKINYMYANLNTLPNTWGDPGPNCTDLQKKSYSDKIKLLSSEEQKKIDIVFIDGRFRVACALKCHKLINNNCIVIIDDFFKRTHYHKVLDYYNIINKTNDDRMVFLIKKNIDVPENIIKYYELQRD